MDAAASGPWPVPSRHTHTGAEGARSWGWQAPSQIPCSRGPWPHTLRLRLFSTDTRRAGPRAGGALPSQSTHTAWGAAHAVLTALSADAVFTPPSRHATLC